MRDVYGRVFDWDAPDDVRETPGGRMAVSRWVYLRSGLKRSFPFVRRHGNCFCAPGIRGDLSFLLADEVDPDREQDRLW